MNQVLTILAETEPISLAEMDSVKLLDRTDTKFVFHKSKLPEILEELKSNYRILEIDNVRISDYETLYFDTAAFNLYMHHHNGKLNRYKIRFRKYVGSNLHFFEIKFKNNKGRTLKSRIKQKSVKFAITNKAKQLLEDTTNLKASSLLPAFWVNYSRITFVSQNFQERLTFDINLTIKNETQEKTFTTLIIAELKRDKASLKSPFILLMNNKKIRKYSISKYCFGVTQLYPKIKRNKFKPKLLTLNKIIYATPQYNR